MKVSQGRGFPLVIRIGVGHMPVLGENKKEAAQGLVISAAFRMQLRQQL